MRVHSHYMGISVWYDSSDYPQSIDKGIGMDATLETFLAEYARRTNTHRKMKHPNALHLLL
jgi:hypothetical protein